MDVYYVLYKIIKRIIEDDKKEKRELDIEKDNSNKGHKDKKEFD